MKRFWIASVFLVLLAAAGYIFWNGRPGKTPPGQPPLVEIKSAALEEIKTEFNRASDRVRVIALLSPT
ncbi:MAG TPA: hypothetical protein VGK64_08865 [Bryobacteraceae bacterium]